MSRRICPAVILGATVALCALFASATPALAAPLTAQSGAAPVDAFPTSGACSCHGDQVRDWSDSMHSRALEDPIYLAKLEQGMKETDGAIGPLCKTCHGPVAAITGEMGGELSPESAEAVGCMFCHQAVGISGKPGNTSHLVEPDGTRRAQLEKPTAPHPAAYSAFHESGEMCGGCHNVDHPTTGVHLETTYTEWKESPYAAEGVVCQDCHMSKEVGTVGPFSGFAAAGGRQRDNLYRMSFVGANAILGPADSARALLRSAADIELEMPEIVAAGESASITVSITNKGAGHYLPTGLTEVRQMWLSVHAETADGERTSIGERYFITELADAEGNHPVEMWDAVSIHSDDRIPPRGTVTQDYVFRMPEADQTVRVVAALNYKSVPDELAKKAKVDNPTTEMAIASTRVFASEQARREAPEEPVSAQGGRPLSWPLIAGVAGFALVVAVAFAVIVRRKKA